MRFAWLVLLLVACRGSDGRTQSAPPRADSAAADSLLFARADAGRIQGDTTAIWFLEVSDFQCPFCKRFHDDAYQAIVNEYVRTGRIRMAYVNLPLQQHAHAQQAAEAAMCAAAQSRFWQMHDALFATQERWAPMALPDVTQFFDSLATSVGVAHDDWRSCVKGSAIGRLVDGDRAGAIRSGVKSTPTFLIGDRVRIEGAQPIELFRRAIEEAMKPVPAPPDPTQPPAAAPRRQ